MIRLVGQLICKDETEAALVSRYLPDHIRLTRAEPGCLSFEVPQIAPLIWEVRERFTDRAAFDAHQTRTKASDWYLYTAGIAREYQVDEG
jgi:quinol monooxygenase YgiN